jgi:hypothetical protein
MADESLASAVVKRLRNQPFLFVLGIAALLVGLLTSGAGLGTPEFRLILALIGGLAFLVVIGYYVVAVLRVREAPAAGGRSSGPAGSRADEVGRASDASSAQARAERASDPAPRAPDPAPAAPTYNVSAHGAVIGAIGSHATVTMGSTPPPVAAPPGAPAPAAPPAPPASATAVDDLDRARRNLGRLESKRALYAAGTEPRELLDEIAREQRRIAELTSPRDAAPDTGRTG